MIMLSFQKRTVTSATATPPDLKAHYSFHDQYIDKGYKITDSISTMVTGLKTAVFSGKDVGGTCVNRGCVPSKALLAAAGRVREMQDDHHLDSMGIKASNRSPVGHLCIACVSTIRLKAAGLS